MGILAVFTFLVSIFCCSKCIQKYHEEEPEYSYIVLFNTNELSDSVSSEELPPNYDELLPKYEEI